MDTVPISRTGRIKILIVIAVAAMFMAMFLPLAVFPARVAELPQLPEGFLPNSEISTNIPFQIDISRIDCIMFDIGLDSSQSNCLMIALGETAGDELALEDADIAWGYDCGECVFDETGTGTVRRDGPDGTPRAANTFAIQNRDLAITMDKNACELNPWYRHSQQRRDNLARLRPIGLTGKRAEIYNAAQQDAACEK